MEERTVADDERYAMVSKGILVAKDRSALNEYKKKAEKQKDNNKTLNTLRRDVDNLQSDISDIKSMLTQILDNHEKEDIDDASTT